ncbi:MAG: restriction endonuclease subunit S [Anaerolineales bacterium]
MANGWQTVPLGKILKRVKRETPIEDDVTYKQVTVRLWNKGVILRGEQQGSEIKTKRQFMVSSGQLILSRIDVRNGAIGLCPVELDGAIISNDFWAYDFDRNLIYPEFLEYYVKTPGFIDDANRTSSGTTKRIRSDEGAFLRIEIPLPPPLTEQRRIVARIEALAGRVAAALSLRREASNEASLLIKSWVSKVFDYESGDSLPKGWTWKSFAQVLEPDGMRTGPFGTALNKSEIMDDGVPVFGIANVGNNKFMHGFTDFVSFEKAEALSSYTLQAGDIAVARSGTVGRSCVVPEGLFPEPIMSSNLIRMRINAEVFLPDLMCRILNGSKLVERHKDKECRGSSRIFFTQKILNRFQLPVPPLPEQRQLVAYLDGLQGRVSALRAAQAESEKELAALMPSVLDRAFKGEL